MLFHLSNIILLFPQGTGGNFLAEIIYNDILNLIDTGRMSDANNEYVYKGSTRVLNPLHMEQFFDSSDNWHSFDLKKHSQYHTILNNYKHTKFIIVHPDCFWYTYALWNSKRQNIKEIIHKELLLVEILKNNNKQIEFESHVIDQYRTVSDYLKSINSQVLDISYSDLFLNLNKDTIKILIEFLLSHSAADIENTVYYKIKEYRKRNIQHINDLSNMLEGMDIGELLNVQV